MDIRAWVIVAVLWTSSPVEAQVIALATCDSAAVLEADRGWAAAASSKDVDALMAFYDRDATQWPNSGSPIAGRDALRELFTRLFQDPGYALSWSASRLTVAGSCDLAYSLGTWTMTARGRDGALVDSKGTYLAVWVRNTDGRWVVKEDMFNRAAA